MIFSKHKPDALLTSFSLLISNGKLSKYAHSIALSGRMVAKNMLASECIVGYAKLLENILAFPSDAMLPSQASKLVQGAWEWSVVNLDLNPMNLSSSGVVSDLEDEMTKFGHVENISESEVDVMADEIPTELDWNVLAEIESSEEVQILETEEVW